MMGRTLSWNEITDMTRVMLSHARSGEWDTVIAIESQRQDKMREFFEVSIPLDAAQGMAEGISRVMALDKEIMSLGKSGVRKLGDSLTQIKRGKKAQFAYQKLA